MDRVSGSLLDSGAVWRGGKLEKGLGYAFGSQWELINDFIAQFSGFILSLVMTGAGIYLVARFWRSTPGKYCEAKTAQPG